MSNIEILDLLASHRPARTLGLEVVGELSEGELADAARTPAALPTVRLPPSLTELRWVHHEQAKLLAAGKSSASVAAIMGVGPARVKRLLGDPAFMELVEYYKQQRDEVYWDAQKHLANVGMAVAGELQHRLETNPDQFTPTELVKIGEFAFDRSVAPPKSTQQAPTQNTIFTLNLNPLRPAATMVTIDQSGGDVSED